MNTPAENSPRKVLMIEDEHDLLVLYQEVLVNAGYEVETATNGETGKDFIIDKPWDILILDIMLPKIDGMELLKEIKDTPGMKKGKVIVITNLNSEDIIQEAFNRGAEGVLIKSEITPDKIIDEIVSLTAKDSVAETNNTPNSPTA